MDNTETHSTITRLLLRLEGKDAQPADALFQNLYDEIHALAIQQLQRLSPGQTMTPTVLVHECYLRVVQQNTADFKTSQHMLGHLARVMRCYLVDAVRMKHAAKREVPMDNLPLGTSTENGINTDLLDLDKTLELMEGIRPDLAQLVEMRYFLGLSIAEISQLSPLSDRQLYRRWSKAKTLFIALSRRDDTPSENGHSGQSSTPEHRT